MTTILPTIEDLIEKGDHLVSAILGKAEGLADRAQVKTLKDAAKAHGDLIDAARELISGKSETNILADISHYLKDKKFGSLNEAREFIATRLHQVNEETNVMRNGAKTAKLFYESLAHTAEKSPTFLSRIGSGASYVFENTLGKHQQWLNEQSHGKRLGFAVGYMALGSLLTDMGVRMAAQGFGGTKQESVQTLDEKGNQHILVMNKPLPAAERVVKAIIGTGGIAAGITGTGVGFYNIFNF